MDKAVTLSLDICKARLLLFLQPLSIQLTTLARQILVRPTLAKPQCQLVSL